MEFVFNEWFLDWHLPNAELEEKRKVKLIFDWLKASEHRLVVLSPSPFINKLNKFRRSFNTGFSGNALKEIASGIAIAREKYRRIETPLDLPNDIEEILKRPPKPPLKNVESDRYLFQSAEATEEKIIVTTDTKLIKHFEGNERYQLWSVEEFMRKFGIE